ncbi:MAG: MEMO1 family protein [Candidatus Aenigmarchaeota archaeon]|nr:MEMO1 family protein [Candidatus Aenigmarchaeota archaeon]
MIVLREPTVAGTFYNLDAESLKKQINYCFSHKLGPKSMKKQKVIAAVVPHAGYVYSGPIAAWTYSKLDKANFIILGPNHSGMGARFALMKSGLWKTPLGEVVINEDVAEKLAKECKILEYDVLAHQYEHSIEVQLPFLQFKFGDDFKFVPICVLNEFADDTLLESCRLIGKGIASVIKKQKEKWVVLASSDFSHYVPQEIAEKTDKTMIRSILKLDEKEFFQKINEKSASLCGFGPIAIAMIAAKELGSKKAELLKYASSGDVTQDFASVVGYASIIMT